MPQPKRHDKYGRPLPTLAPAPRRAVLHHAQNTAVRRYLLWLLEHEYAELFQAGIWADMTVTLRLCDGILREEIDIEVTRHHRCDSGER